MFAPWRSQKSVRKRKDPITGNSFIVSVFAYAQAFDLCCEEQVKSKHERYANL